MNQYTELLSYIKLLAEQDEYINTVLEGDADDSYLDKNDIYPVFNVNIVSGGFTNGNSVRFSVILECFAIRQEIKNEVNEDKFWRSNNKVDNHNETFASLNRIFTRMYRDFDDNNISVSENPECEKGTFVKGNTCDGWNVTFDIEVPNDILNLCT